MPEPPARIPLLVITGSVRPGNYTTFAAALVLDELRKNPDVEAELIDPAGLGLPAPGVDPACPAARQLQERVSQAAGVVLVTPEYHGSFSSVLKLIIEDLGYPSALSGKSVALLGVAAGSIGAIKSLEHLRSVVSHVGALALPLPISIASVHRVFDRDGRCLDPRSEALIRSAAAHLLDYLRQNVCPRFTLERLLRDGA